MPRKEAKLPPEQGGFRGPDLFSAWIGQKIAWIRKLLLERNNKWTEILEAKLQRISPHLHTWNLNDWSMVDINLVIRSMDLSIWKEIFISLKTYILQDLKQSKEKALKFRVWGMSILKNENGNTIRLAQVRTLHDQKILPIDIVKINNNGIIHVKSTNEIMTMYPTLPANQVEHARKALEIFFRDTSVSKAYRPSLIPPMKSYIVENICKYESGASWWTKTLKYNASATQSVRQREIKWETTIPRLNMTEYFWIKQYKMIEKIRFDNRTKLRQLQLCKGNTKTNIIVKHIVDGLTENCSFCDNVPEKIDHLFHHCPKVTELRERVNTHFKDSWLQNNELSTVEDTLFMDYEQNLSSRNVFKLILKDYIWKRRCSGLAVGSVEELMSYMKSYVSIHVLAKSFNWLVEGTLTRAYDPV
jgi:hypothetical protein